LIKITYGVYDREKIFFTPIGFYGPISRDQGARLRSQNGNPVIIILRSFSVSP
jgi:hypothetical protein